MPLNKNPEKEILQLLTQKTDSVFAAEMREQQKMFLSKSFELSLPRARQFVLLWPSLAGIIW